MGEYITPESRREYTGKIYEADFLGTVELPPEFEEKKYQEEIENIAAKIASKLVKPELNN